MQINYFFFFFEAFQIVLHSYLYFHRGTVSTTAIQTSFLLSLVGGTAFLFQATVTRVTLPLHVMFKTQEK